MRFVVPIVALPWQVKWQGLYYSNGKANQGKIALGSRVDSLKKCKTTMLRFRDGFGARPVSGTLRSVLHTQRRPIVMYAIDIVWMGMIRSLRDLHLVVVTCCSWNNFCFCEFVNLVQFPGAVSFIGNGFHGVIFIIEREQFHPALEHAFTIPSTVHNAMELFT